MYIPKILETFISGGKTKSYRHTHIRSLTKHGKNFETVIELLIVKMIWLTSEDSGEKKSAGDNLINVSML